MAYAVHVCFFSGAAFDALKPREKRDYELVKAAVLKDGRFSAFDATSTPTLARIFDQMERDPTVKMDHGEAFPWIGVRKQRTLGEIIPAILKVDR